MSSPTDQAGGQPAVLREPAASELHVEDQGRDHQRGGAAADIVEQVLVGDMADPALDEALAQVMGTLLDAVIAAVPAAVPAARSRSPSPPPLTRSSGSSRSSVEDQFKSFIDGSADDSNDTDLASDADLASERDALESSIK